jgi:DNA-binding CsgD family transcriptional regulator
VIDEATVLAILAYPIEVSSEDIGADLGLNRSTVRCIRIGKRRANIAPDLPRISPEALRQSCLDNQGTPEPIVRAILTASLDISCTELACRHKISHHTTVTDIRTGRARRSICPDLQRVSAAVLMRTCQDCKLFEANPRRFYDDDGVDTRRPGYCTIGIPECLESPTFARSCSAFQPRTRLASNHGQHLLQRPGD